MNSNEPRTLKVERQVISTDDNYDVCADCLLPPGYETNPRLSAMPLLSPCSVMTDV